MENDDEWNTWVAIGKVCGCSRCSYCSIAWVEKVGAEPRWSANWYKGQRERLTQLMREQNNEQP